MPSGNVFEDELNRRLTGASGDATQQTLSLPGQNPATQRDLNRVLQGQPANSAVGMAPPSILSEQDQARCDYLVREFLRAIRNTNITASEPAHAMPMLWSTPIDLSARYTLAAAAGAYNTVLTYTAPPGRWARISAYGVDVDGSFTYDGSILWQIKLNGQPVQDLFDWGQHRGSLIQPSETFILVPQGQTVEFQVRRASAAGGTSDVDMVLKGWSWRLRDDYEGTKASVTAF